MDLDGIPRWWDVLKVDTSVMSNSDERSTLSKTAAVAAKTAGLHAIGNDEGDVKGGAKVPCGPLGYIWTACGQGVGGDDGTGDGVRDIGISYSQHQNYIIDPCQGSMPRIID